MPSMIVPTGQQVDPVRKGGVEKMLNLITPLGKMLKIWQPGTVCRKIG